MQITIRKKNAFLQAGKVLIKTQSPGPYGINLHLFVKKSCREWGYVNDDGVYHSFGLGPLFLIAW